MPRFRLPNHSKEVCANGSGDYALFGDLQTAALVSRDGSMDWMCLPRFDSGACFAALLGDERNGRWRLAPDDPDSTPRHRYVTDRTLAAADRT